MPTFFINSDSFKASNAFVATLGAAPGSTYLGQIIAAGLPTAANAMLAAMAATTAATRADAIAANLGLTGTAATTASTYLQTVAFAGAASTHGQGLLTALDLFTTLQNDATFGTAASAYVARVNTALSYSSVAANNSTDLTTLAAAVGSAGSSGAGSTFTLTANTDVFTPTTATKTTSGNDTFYGLGNGDLTSADVIDGGSGTDSILGAATANSQTIAPTLTSVENVTITHTAADTKTFTFNGANATGLERVTIKNAGAVSDNAGDETITLSGLNKAVTVGIDGGIASTAATGGVVAATFTSAAAGDTQKVAISNKGQVTSLTLSTAETVEITATDTGSKANTIGTLAATAVKTLNIKGSGDLTIGASDLAATVTVDASTATGAISFTGENTTTLTFKGGSGNDTIIFGANELTSADSVDLGAGSNTLSIADTALGGTGNALNAVVNGITSAQTIRVTGAATVDMSGVTARILSLGPTSNYVVQKLEAADKVQVNGVTAGTLDATAALGFNTLNLEMNGGAAVAAVGATTVTNQATINIVSATTATTTAGANTIGAITNSANASFVVTGANALTITSLSAAASFDASAATGVITVTGANAASILKGGSGADVITGGTVAGGDELIGGAGNDTINTAVITGTTATKITGGLGADTINIKGVTQAAEVYTVNATAAESFATALRFDTVNFVDRDNTDKATVTLVTGVATSTVTGATSVTIGTTTVVAGSFLAVGSASATLTTTDQNFQIYQDSNSNGIIDATDLRVDFVAAGADTTAVSIVGNQLVVEVTGAA